MPMLALAGLSLVSGLVVLPDVGKALGLPGGLGEFLFYHEPEVFHLDTNMALISTLIAILGLAISAGFYWWGMWSAQALQARFAWFHQLLERKYYLDDFYQMVIDRVVLVMGAFIALFDRAVVNDMGVNGAGAVAVVAGDKLKYTETGKLPNYLLAMGIGVIAAVAAVLTFLPP